MKYSFALTFLILSFLINGCNSDNSNSNPENYFKQFSSQKSQNFFIGTKESFLITSEKGIKILFLRENFNLQNDDEVKVVLKEIVSFKELLYHNISTVSTNDQLLVSLGGIYIEFIANGKKVSLKENRGLEIIFPNSVIGKNKELYFSRIDSIGNFKWERISVAVVSKSEIQANEVFLSKLPLIPFDLQSSYSKDFHKYEMISDSSIVNSDNSTQSLLLNNTIINSGWCFSFSEIKPKTMYSFYLNIDNDNFNVLSVYFLYKGKNSFKSEYRNKENLRFERIPVIENRTSLVVVAKKNKKYFADKIDLPNDDFIVNLKEINTLELETILLH